MQKLRWTVGIGVGLALVIAVVAMAGPLNGVALAGSLEDGLPGAPHSPHGIGPLATVADTLDMSVPQLLYALHTRHDSIADLAEARQSESDEVVQALVDKAAERLSHTDNLTQEQVNWILAQVERKAEGFVDVEFPYGAAIDTLKPAADSIGISVDELVDEMQDGKTIAEVAEDNDVDTATVEQAIIDHRATILDEAVEVGLLTETQADILLDLFSSKVPDIVNGELPFGHLRDFLARRRPPHFPGS
ncbi:MAG: hypothetical protein MAG451_02997 [Anaerolineales bacterium]|nr:hypothetical protein [Anaerolineales bacterium]